MTGKHKIEKILLTTTDADSAVIIGGKWEAVVKLLPPSGTVIITDTNVSRIYGRSFPGVPVLKVRPGESAKRLVVVEKLAAKLLELGVDRSGFILAIGGGVVCDLAGFLASVYLRGIKFGYVSTTLLAQVDASTGGKNGVNLGNVKNILGTFSQPEFVVIDTTMLDTLPEDEYLSGLAELIKTGLIGETSIIEILENEKDAVLSRDRDLMTELVARAVKFKAAVVAQDEKESGLRRILNFGHTFGHAIELHGGMKHGIAVAAGMLLAGEFSVKAGLLEKSEFKRLVNLLKMYGLSPEFDLSHDKAMELMMHDKKRSGGSIWFVFLEGLGKPLVKKITFSEISDFYKKAGNNKSR
jgi:3-dehydroquinate synthase